MGMFLTHPNHGNRVMGDVVAVDYLDNHFATCPWYKRWFLNSELDAWLDIRDVATCTIILILIRYVVFGVGNPKFQVFPSLMEKYVCPKICKPTKNHKFAETAWFLLNHTIFFLAVFGFMFENYYEEDSWVRNYLFDFNVVYGILPAEIDGPKGWPFHYLSPQLRCFIVFNFSFWLSALVILLFERRRNDFYQMFIHHCVTCFLVFVSYIAVFYRFLLMTLLFHDVVDVLLYGAKLLNYTKLNEVYAKAVFGLFVVSFVLLRCIAFPVALLLTPMRIVACGYVEFSALTHYLNPAVFELFLLFGLWALHMIWLVLILKMFISLIKGDLKEDSRSEASDDKED